jgi:3-oxoacyl-[acyl-carrier protein] reductase
VGQQVKHRWGRLKVNVNCVAFSLIHTRMTVADANASATISIAGNDIRVDVKPKLIKSHAMLCPLGRGGTPEAAAGSVFLFCTPESNYITGQVVGWRVAGGGWRVVRSKRLRQAVPT